MNKELQTVFTYHEQTKHAQHRYARSLGYMDWETQPNPFREYKSCETIQLPLADDNSTPPYNLLDEDLPPAPLLKESISQLMQFSMGIAAWKESGGSSWAVRCNASSGNLHPTESYLVLPPVLEEQNGSTCIYHYAPKKHTLEKLAQLETSLWDELPEGSFIIGLSSIVWREIWKYGERAFRYTQLDAGHAWNSIEVSAKLLGWSLTRLDSISHNDMSTLLGLSQENRFFEDEEPDMLFVVSPNHVDPSLSLDSLISATPLSFDSIANKLSSKMQSWEIIPQIQDATCKTEVPQKSLHVEKIKREPSYDSKYVVLNRRSIHVMQKEVSEITSEQFHTVLNSVAQSQDKKENSAHLAIFVHQVETYEAGLYMLIRNDRDLENLKEQMYSHFEWKETEFKNLYFLYAKDFTMTSRAISCSQDIASDGAFSLGMLCNFSEQLQTHGAHRYKELYWECGAIGQQLYLEATSLRLSGTGIGCFLDDDMHNVLGLKDNRFQILYHFTVGRGYVDSRIMTKPAY
ncbi:nitroreductase family protein [Sulfurimonas sp.]|nr:nitroreductase family protein [Sulfurimonas sp.]